jgi:hypothetical protein
MSSSRMKSKKSKGQSRLTLADRFARLLAEKRRRQMARALDTPPAPPAPTMPTISTAEETWRAERAAWSAAVQSGYQAPAGEIANVMDGLTPRGVDKKGRKVSFVETGYRPRRRWMSTPDEFEEFDLL